MKHSRQNQPGKGKTKKRWSAALVFILLFGIVSLFSDMTHEGADSIRGAYLAALGASAGTIGFISGLGELVGYSLRYVFGKLSDKTGKYWFMTIAGYVLDVICVPALALVGSHGWIAACILLVIQ
jgi:MFS family permease